MTSPEMLQTRITNSNQEQAIREGKVIILQIAEDLLPSYKRLADINDLNLTVVGKSGDRCYITRRSFFTEQKSEKKRKAIPHLIVRPKPVETPIPAGVVAVSFDRPSRIKNYEAFEKTIADLRLSAVRAKISFTEEILKG